MFCGTTCRNQLFLNFIPTGLVCCLHQSTTSLEGLGSSLGSSLGGSLGAPPHSWFSNGRQEPLFHKGDFARLCPATKLLIGHPP